MSRVIAVLFMSFVLLSNANASVIQLDSTGSATGIDNFEVEGELYNVSFNVGNFLNAFGFGDVDDRVLFNDNLLGAQDAVSRIATLLNESRILSVGNTLSGLADSFLVVYRYEVGGFSASWSGADAPLPWGNASSGSASGIGASRFATSAFDRTFAFVSFDKVMANDNTNNAILEPALGAAFAVFLSIFAWSRSKKSL